MGGIGPLCGVPDRYFVARSKSCGCGHLEVLTSFSFKYARQVFFLSHEMKEENRSKNILNTPAVLGTNRAAEPRLTKQVEVCVFTTTSPMGVCVMSVKFSIHLCFFFGQGRLLIHCCCSLLLPHCTVSSMCSLRCYGGLYFNFLFVPRFFLIKFAIVTINGVGGWVGEGAQRMKEMTLMWFLLVLSPL